MYPICKIKNVSGEIKNIIKEFTIGEIYQIPTELRMLYANNEDLKNAILAEDFEVYADDILLDTNTSIAFLKNKFDSSLAVDKNGNDQELSGTDWIEITSNRVIWDIHNDYDSENEDFIVPFDGIYFHDLQLKIKNILLTSSIEVAIFKRGEPDDYWFIVDKKIIQGETDVQLSGSIMFDFYEDERYCLKIKLTGVLPSCDIDGDDDFTAWGFNFDKSLYI